MITTGGEGFDTNAGGNRTGDLTDNIIHPMERCPACGRRRLRQGRCDACGHVARDAEIGEGGGSALPPTVDRGIDFYLNDPVEGHFGLQREVPSGVPTVRPSSAPVRRSEVSTAIPSLGARPQSVSGRVLYLSPISYEPMDLDPWRWVANPSWGLVLLAAPMAATLTVWELGGSLYALGVAFFLFLVLRYVFSNRLIDTWHLISALNGRHVVESIPVQVVRVRQWEGREAQLRFKGHFANGALMEGDRIQATGRWRGGVFTVCESICERTGARIVPRQPRARTFALSGLAVLFGLILWILIAGVSVHARLREVEPPTTLPVGIPVSTTPVLR